MSPPVSEVSRKFSGSKNQLWKTAAGLFYEPPPPDLEALDEAPGALRSFPILGDLAYTFINKSSSISRTIRYM